MAQRTLRWKFVDNNGDVLDYIDQTPEDNAINGVAYILASLIPIEHIDEAEKGEWVEEGFVYSVGDDVYTIELEIVCR